MSRSPPSCGVVSALTSGPTAEAVIVLAATTAPVNGAVPNVTVVPLTV